MLSAHTESYNACSRWAAAVCKTSVLTHRSVAVTT